MAESGSWKKITIHTDGGCDAWEKLMLLASLVGVLLQFKHTRPIAGRRIGASESGCLK